MPEDFIVVPKTTSVTVSMGTVQNFICSLMFLSRIDKIPGINKRLLEQLVDTINKIRKLDLKKKPCISETLDWAKSLIALQVEDLSKEVIRKTLNVICKYKKDVDLTLENLDQIAGN